MNVLNEQTLVAVAAPLSTRWTDRFALEFAMTLEGSGDKPANLLKEYGYTHYDLEAFSKDPLFMQRVDKFRIQLREKGLTFKLKAQAQAELLLDTSWDIIHNIDVSPAVKADLIKWTSKVAGFEPTKDTTAAGDNGVVINIHMGDPALAPSPGIRTIEHD